MTRKRAATSQISELYWHSQNFATTKHMFKCIEYERVRTNDNGPCAWINCWNPKISEICVFRIIPEVHIYRTIICDLAIEQKIDQHFSTPTPIKVRITRIIYEY